jgi:hypothetical protein
MLVETVSMDDASELDPSARGSLRGFLLGARPVIGGFGAGGLKLLACSWFALGLGTLSLLPNAAGAHRTVRMTAEQPRVDAGPGSGAHGDAHRAISKPVPARHRRMPQATPADSRTGVATLDVPVGPRGAGLQGDATATGPAAGSSNPSAASASPGPAEPVIATPPDPLPQPPIVDLPPLPVPSTLPVPPLPPLPLPLPDVGSATSGLPLP